MNALRCRGCGERIDATHWGWCPVGAYATGVQRSECDQVVEREPEPAGEQLALVAE